MTACQIETCDKPPFRRSWCQAHYLRWKRTGDVDAARPIASRDGDFWSKVDRQANGCWTWTAATVKGYGAFKTSDGTRRAHRLAYEELVGVIPEGLVLDHLCRNRACVNPEHLEPVTAGENTLRGVGPSATNRAKTHCIHGHEFDAENTIPTPNGRKCRTCRDERNRARAGKNQHTREAS